MLFSSVELCMVSHRSISFYNTYKALHKLDHAYFPASALPSHIPQYRTHAPVNLVWVLTATLIFLASRSLHILFLLLRMLFFILLAPIHPQQANCCSYFKSLQKLSLMPLAWITCSFCVLTWSSQFPLPWPLLHC